MQIGKAQQVICVYIGTIFFLKVPLSSYFFSTLAKFCTTNTIQTTATRHKGVLIYR